MANGDGRSEFFSSEKNSNYSEDSKMKVLLSIINIINSLRAPPKLFCLSTLVLAVQSAMLLVGKDWKQNKGLERLETGERRKKNSASHTTSEGHESRLFLFRQLVGVLTFFLLQIHIAWTVIDS